MAPWTCSRSGGTKQTNQETKKHNEFYENSHIIDIETQIEETDLIIYKKYIDDQVNFLSTSIIFFQLFFNIVMVLTTNYKLKNFSFLN